MNTGLLPEEMNMVFSHICVYCNSPCEISLALSSENCTNPKCHAYAPALRALETPVPPEPKEGEARIKNEPGFRERVKRAISGLSTTIFPVPCVVAGCTGEIVQSPTLDKTPVCYRCNTWFDIGINAHDKVALVPLPKPTHNFNKEIQRKAADLMTVDPSTQFAGLACPCCQARSMRVVEGSKGTKPNRFVHCFGCGASYEDIQIDDSLHDERRFTMKSMQSATLFQDARPLIDKSGRIVGYDEGVKTGRLRSDQPNMSNIPRADATWPKGPTFIDPEAGWGAPQHYVAPKKETPPCPGCETEAKSYEEKRLRWANTMRVMDRETIMGKQPTKKDGFPILGVLSLVDVDKTGDRAVYDYVALQALGRDTKSSVRMRVEVQRHAPKKPRVWANYIDALRALVGDKSHFDITFTKVYDAGPDFSREVHCIAINLEFEFDRIRARASRTPSIAERAMFSLLKK